MPEADLQLDVYLLFGVWCYATRNIRNAPQANLLAVSNHLFLQQSLYI